jgi:uncharacterized protein
MIETGNIQILMRIFINESDQSRGKPLYQAIIELLHKEDISGVTILRGIAGFGATKRIHTANILRLSLDLPIVIEVVDIQENIERILSKTRLLTGKSLITFEQVSVLNYAPAAVLAN